MRMRLIRLAAVGAGAILLAGGCSASSSGDSQARGLSASESSEMADIVKDIDADVARANSEAAAATEPSAELSPQAGSPGEPSAVSEPTGGTAADQAMFACTTASGGVGMFMGAQTDGVGIAQTQLSIAMPQAAAAAKSAAEGDPSYDAISSGMAGVVSAVDSDDTYSLTTSFTDVMNACVAAFPDAADPAGWNSMLLELNFTEDFGE